MLEYPAYLRHKTFTIPYNNDPVLIEKLGKLLFEPRPIGINIYFAPNPFIANAGRKPPNLEGYLDQNKKFDSNKFDKQLIQILKRAKEHHFKTDLLLNNVLLGLPHFNRNLKQDIPKIQSYLEKLNSEKSLDRITISNPYLLELMNWTRLSNIEIRTSVNFQIKSPKTIELLNNLSKFWLQKSIDVIEIQKDLLRNLTALAKIRKKIGKNIKLSIIINEGCLTGCPYQIAHQLHAFSFPIKNGLIEQKEFLFNIAKCKYVTNKEPWRILDSNWILPPWLKYYAKLIDEFKLTDRSDTTEGILKTVKAYIFNDYDKNNITSFVSLLRLEKFVIPETFLPRDFFQKVTSKKEASNLYFEKIWLKIKNYNKKIGINPQVAIRGKVKEDLHAYIGNS